MEEPNRRRTLGWSAAVLTGVLAGCGSLRGGADDAATTTEQPAGTAPTSQTTERAGGETTATTTERTTEPTTTTATTTTETTTTETTTTETTTTGAAATTTETTTTTAGDIDSITILGQSLLDRPDHGFNEGRIRANGRAVVVGSDSGNGTYLVDTRDPTDISLFHRLPSEADNRDLKFDPLRFGVYYRGEEFRDGGDSRVQIVDYGRRDGTPAEPRIAANIPAGDTHNLYPHPEKPLLYTVNGWPDTPLFDTWDVRDITAPSRVQHGTDLLVGGSHDLLVDPVNDRLHVAVIDNKQGRFEGYRIYDIGDPARPELLGAFDYRDAPDYTAVGEPGFEGAHMVDVDPARGLAVVGDEKTQGVPGGKHVFDIGWGEGSPADPTPVGFTHSPNAEVQDEKNENGDWTGHNFDLVRVGERHRLVSGDNHEGIVLYDIDDPRAPTPLARYATDDNVERSNGPVEKMGGPPMTWSAHYSERARLGVASDVLTGVYTFRLA